MRYRNLALASLSFAALWAVGCSSCHSCGTPWFSKARRCDPCMNGGAVGVAPAVGAPVGGAIVTPPPGAITSPPPGAVVVPTTTNLGPTPDAVIRPRIETQPQPFYYNGRRYYYN